mmetsp:Transcript_104518/g.302456  ORF Transcript_104518/g.302456 Transcript_104518/m.302456 type:complete len:269 (+) Transcript_104518:244-1050(+)
MRAIRCSLVGSMPPNTQRKRSPCTALAVWPCLWRGGIPVAVGTLHLPCSASKTITRGGWSIGGPSPPNTTMFVPTIVAVWQQHGCGGFACGPVNCRNSKVSMSNTWSSSEPRTSGSAPPLPVGRKPIKAAKLVSALLAELAPEELPQLSAKPPRMYNLLLCRAIECHKPASLSSRTSLDSLMPFLSRAFFPFVFSRATEPKLCNLFGRSTHVKGRPASGPAASAEARAIGASSSPSLPRKARTYSFKGSSCKHRFKQRRASKAFFKFA